MKKLLLAGIVAFAPLLAHATELMQSGYWSTFTTKSNTGNVGTPICGMQTFYGSNENPLGAIFIKYFQGYPGLAIQLFRHGWLGHYHIPMRLYLDQTLVASVTAEGKQPEGSGDVGVIEFFISADKTMSFLGQFADADWMYLMFDAGNEGYWRANMRGSRDAVMSMQNCIASLNASPPVAANPPAADPPVKPPRLSAPTQDTVRLYPDSNGLVVYVDVGLGDQTVRMALDTGATHIVLNKSIADALIKTGEAQLLKEIDSELANGAHERVRVVSINLVRIGNHILHMVPAMVHNDDKGNMLLGFSVLNEIGKFTIDTRNQELTFNAPGT
jgi:clan AA aspartic protease (TIGR02281 family)